MYGYNWIYLYVLYLYIYINHKKVYSIWYPITSCMHTYSHHLSSMTSPPPKKKVHKRGRSTCRRTPRFVAVCIVHSVHVGCWGKALHRWSWIEPRGCDPNATLSGVTIPDLLNFRWAGGPSPKKTRSRFEMLGIYIVLRELTTLTIVRNVLFLIKDFKHGTSEKMGRQL